MQNAENAVNAQVMEYRSVYPEVYYKLQPYVMMVCDQMDTYGPMMPSQEMMDKMADNIYDDICAMYPDIAEYARSAENTMPDTEAVETITQFRGFDRGRDFRRRRFRRRGVFRDLIASLLLSEFSRRRRRVFNRKRPRLYGTNEMNGYKRRQARAL
jgi:hypothetical protein